MSSIYAWSSLCSTKNSHEFLERCLDVLKGWYGRIEIKYDDVRLNLVSRLVDLFGAGQANAAAIDVLSTFKPPRLVLQELKCVYDSKRVLLKNIPRESAKTIAHPGSGTAAIPT